MFLELDFGLVGYQTNGCRISWYWAIGISDCCMHLLIVMTWHSPNKLQLLLAYIFKRAKLVSFSRHLATVVRRVVIARYDFDKNLLL